MTRFARSAHAVLAGLFLLALPVQFYLAGIGAFKVASYDAHAAIGSLLTLLSLLILIFVLIGRSGSALTKLTALLFVLMIVQNVLAALGDTVGGVAALHPVNGLLIVGVSIALANRARVYLPIRRLQPAGAVTSTAMA